MLGSGRAGNGRSVSSSNSSTMAALRDMLLQSIAGERGNWENKLWSSC